MDSEQHNNSRTLRSNRTSVLSDEATSIEEGMKGLRQRHKALQDAKGQLNALNSRLIELLKVEDDKRLPFEQTFRTFKAGLEAEKQRELMLMALKRNVSSTSFNLNFPASSSLHRDTTLQLSHKENLGKVANAQDTIASSSMTSMEEEICAKDSGLGIDVMGVLKEEMDELKVENSTLQSQIVYLKKEVEDLRAFIGEKDVMVERLKGKCAMYEEDVHSITSQLNEASTVRKFLEDKLALKDSELKKMEVTNENKILKINVEHNGRLLEEGSKMKCLEEELARFRNKDVEMSKKLKKLEVDSSAVQLANNAINDALTDSYEEERVEYEKNIEGCKRKFAERDAFERSLAEKASSTELKLSKANCELAGLKKIFQCKEMEFTHEMEVARAKLGEEGMTYQNKIEELKRRMKEEEALRKSWAERASSTDILLSKANRELVDTKKMLKCKEMECTKENEIFHAKFLEEGMKYQEKIDKLERKLAKEERKLVEEQAKKVRISKKLEFGIKLATKEIDGARKINVAYKEDIKKLQMELERSYDKIEKQHKQIKVVGDSLCLKEEKINQCDKETKVLIHNVHLKDENIVELSKQVKVRGDCLRLTEKRIEELNKKLIVCEDILHSKDDEIKQLDELAKAFGENIHSKDEKMEQLKKEMKDLADKLNVKDLAIEKLIAKKKRRRSIRRLFCF